MISDILGMFALVTKLPDDQLEERALAGTQMKIFTNAIWRNIIGQSTYQLAILLILKLYGKRLLKLSGEDAGFVLHTVIFNTFVLCQVRSMYDLQYCWSQNFVPPMLVSSLELLNPFPVLSGKPSL
jgi:Ca2+-transporting ATPase